MEPTSQSALLDLAQPHWADDVSLPALLGAARRTYGTAIRSALAGAGLDDMPSRGSFVLASIRRDGFPGTGPLAESMGVSKQAVSQLVDSLVVRGYLERVVDADDRRRMTITLTERGVSAATEIRAAVDRVDVAVAALVGESALAITRRVVGVCAAADPPA